jgi:hypothetical protein
MPHTHGTAKNDWRPKCGSRSIGPKESTKINAVFNDLLPEDDPCSVPIKINTGNSLYSDAWTCFSPEGQLLLIGHSSLPSDFQTVIVASPLTSPACNEVGDQMNEARPAEPQRFMEVVTKHEWDQKRITVSNSWGETYLKKTLVHPKDSPSESRWTTRRAYGRRSLR